MNTDMRFVFVPSVPNRYKLATFDSYEPRTDRQRHTVETLRQLVRTRYVADGIGAVVLFGGVGVGKTHLGCALLQETARADLTPDESPAEMAEWLRNFQFVRWRDIADADPRMLASPHTTLMVDDLTAPATKVETAALQAVIGDRYDGGSLRLIVTTNLTPHELRDALGDRLADRLAEGVMPLALDGESYRASIRGADRLVELLEEERDPAGTDDRKQAAPAGPPAKLIELRHALGASKRAAGADD